jgi:hypothetical protein
MRWRGGDVDDLHLIRLKGGHLLNAIDNLLLDLLDAPAYFLVAHRQEQDHDEQAVEKNQQEHKSPLAVQVQLVLQPRKPVYYSRAKKLGHDVPIPETARVPDSQPA